MSLLFLLRVLCAAFAFSLLSLFLFNVDLSPGLVLDVCPDKSLGRRADRPGDSSTLFCVVHVSIVLRMSCLVSCSCHCDVLS